MSDLREQAERMIEDETKVRRLAGWRYLENGDVLWKASDFRDLCEELWELAARLQVELLAEKESK